MSRVELGFLHRAFAQGDLSWLLHPKQAEIWHKSEAQTRAGHNRHVLCLGRRFGKSLLLLAKAFSIAIREPGSEVMYAALSQRQANDIIRSPMMLLRGWAPNECRPERRGGEHWEFPNGSILTLSGVVLNDGDRIRGRPLHAFIFDEAGFYKKDLEYLIDEVIEPTFSNTNGQLFISSTPSRSLDHPFVQKYIREAIETDDFYHGTIYDNPTITQRFRKRLLEQEQIDENSEQFRREYLADYTIADSNRRVTRSYDNEQNDAWLTNWQPPALMRRFVAIDYGSVDHTGVVFASHDWFNGVLVVEEEYFKQRPGTTELVRIIKETEARLWPELNDVKHSQDERPEVVRFSDHDPRLIQDMWVDHGLRVFPARKIPNKDAMLNRLDSNIAAGKVRISPGCVNLRHQLSTGVWNSSFTDYERSSHRIGHLDLLDALVYLNLGMDRYWREHWGDQPDESKPVGPQPRTIEFKPPVDPTKPFESLHEVFADRRQLGPNIGPGMGGVRGW